MRLAAAGSLCLYAVTVAGRWPAFERLRLNYQPLRFVTVDGQPVLEFPTANNCLFLGSSYRKNLIGRS